MAVAVGQRCVVRIKITDVELRKARDIKATIVSPQGEEKCQNVSFDEVSGVVYASVDVNSVGSWSMWLGVRFDKELFYTPAFVFAEVEGDAKSCDAPYIVDVEVAGESVSVTPPKVDVDAITREEFEQLSKKVEELSSGGGISITIDKELSATSDNAVANSAVTKAINAMPTKKGYYPDMSVGMADNLVGRGDVQDAYINFRPSAGADTNITDGAARIKAIKGNSVVHNQLCKNSKFTDGISYWSGNNASISAIGGGGVYFVTTTSSSQSLSQTIKAPKGHKILVVADQKRDFDGQYTSVIYLQRLNGSYDIYRTNSYSSTYRMTISGIINTTDEIKGILYYPAMNAPTGSAMEVYSIIIIDLTQMFGAGNEPATIEEFNERKPMNIDEYAYNAGTLVDMKVDSLVSVSDNAYDYTKGYARVMGGYKYDITANAGATLVVSFYADGEDDNEEREIAPDSEGKYTFPANGICYVNGDFASRSDVCVCLKHSYDKPHPAYQQEVKDLSFIGEAFPNGMRSAGSAFDEIRFNKTTKVWEKVERVGVRAYVEGDAENRSITTDGKTTNYPLDNPTPTTIDLSPNFNLDYFVWDFGTEEAIASVPSAPFRADINYEPNAVDDLRWAVAEIRNLKAQLAQMSASVANLTE